MDYEKFLTEFTVTPDTADGLGDKWIVRHRKSGRECTLRHNLTEWGVSGFGENHETLVDLPAALQEIKHRLTVPSDESERSAAMKEEQRMLAVMSNKNAGVRMCGNCMHYDPIIGLSKGWCRRFPPVLNDTFPKVDMYSCCNEFNHKVNAV